MSTDRIDVLAVLDELHSAARFYCDREGVANRSPYADDMLRRGEEARAAVAELVEQQKRDAQLVAVLLSYLNDSLSVHDKSRLVTELANRGLDDHDDKRRAALARVQPYKGLKIDPRRAPDRANAPPR